MKLLDFVYLFFVDLEGIYFKQTFEDYQKKEPGFAQAYIQAYQFAFAAPSNKPLTSAFIKEINSRVASITESSKQISSKSPANKVIIYSEFQTDSDTTTRQISYSASNAGLAEFINTWLIQRAKPVHTLVFESKESGTKRYVLDGKQWHDHTAKKRVKRRTFSIEEDLNSVYQQFNMSSVTTTINCTNPSGSAHTTNTIDDILEEIVKSYNINIKTAKTDDEKLRVIVKNIQLINQLNPFVSGSIRTCYILLNKLLSDNRMSISLLMNPNRMNCCSVEELIVMVKQGQRYARELKNNTGDELILRTSSDEEPTPQLQLLNCPKETMTGVSPALVKEFVHLLTRYIPNERHSALRACFNFFDCTHIRLQKQLLKRVAAMKISQDPNDNTHSLITAKLMAHQYNVALRNACYFSADVALIELILEYRTSLSIDPHDISSEDQKTAFDRLDENRHLTAEQKAKLRQTMSETANSVSDNKGIVRLLAEQCSMQ